MKKLLPARICMVPRLMGVGGMVSFQGKLAEGLRSRGIEVHHDLSEGPFEAVLVIGGTRQLAGLWRREAPRDPPGPPFGWHELDAPGAGYRDSPPAESGVR
jgi:hypothetical protein